MAEITKEIIAGKQITVFRVTGEFTFDEASDAIHKFYKADIPKNFLWDLSEADVSSLGSVEIARILVITQSYAHLREGCKTAFVQSKDHGKGQMVELTQMVPHLRNLMSMTKREIFLITQLFLPSSPL